MAMPDEIAGTRVKLVTPWTQSRGSASRSGDYSVCSAAAGLIEAARFAGMACAAGLTTRPTTLRPTALACNGRRILEMSASIE
jgi:hypothetical protein